MKFILHLNSRGSLRTGDFLLRFLLKKEAQDLNNICIFTTNNYETIDLAMKRRKLLGTSLDFTWSPDTFWKYSERKINWPVNDPDWKFGENEDYPKLFEEAKKMNFDNFESEFIKKTNDVLNSWSNWNKKEREDFARNKLGLSTRRWCPSCYKEVEPEKLSSKQKRIREATEDITMREWELEKKRKKKTYVMMAMKPSLLLIGYYIIYILSFITAKNRI